MEVSHISHIPSSRRQSKSEDNLLATTGLVSSTKCNCLAQDKVVVPRQLDPPSPLHQTVDGSSEYHAVALLLQGSVPEAQHPGNGQGWKYAGAECFWCGVPEFSYILPHLVLPCLFPRSPTAGRDGRATQMGTKGEDRGISLTPPIPRRVSGHSIKHQNQACPPHYRVVFDYTFYTVENMMKGIVPGNCKNLLEEHSEIDTQENFTIEKQCHLKKSSGIPLPRETC